MGEPKKLSKSTLSVIIIVKNEEHDIRACLESVSWADEIIVLDSGSEDNTLSIAKEFTGKIYTSADWKGFGVQKNRALGYATCDWVLSLDADERVSDDLRQEISNAILSEKLVTYKLPRLSSFCGKYMRHSGWWPDYVTRLFKRGEASFSNDLVHERLIFQGEATKFNAPLLHVTYKDLDEVISKINHYSALGARNSFQKGQRGSLIAAITHGIWAFIRTYLLRAGFLDGAEGLMLAVSNAEVTYYRYLKLSYLSNLD
ncbi:glycosyltransferase family 2 protein [Rhodoferax antarcticus]|uniref:glycosyltransferase family 2 protein n=1 Tax=Rhodoferax antarcticus TaxID=81479 RepID=UPI002225B6AB|nr:glycosyltransferase family 2 protein [Rhodoferax antarcticus]MCW2312380.1 glycosyltransferase involved in cell wall biosynthesis [Rhodoferax antarcticus]